MHIIAFGDLHEYIEGLEALSATLRQADLLLVSGDLTRWRGPATAAKVLEAIKQHNTNFLVQVGNTDRWETNHYLDHLGINLHGQGYRFGDLGILGVGGSNSTPFSTPTEFSEAEIAAFLTSGYAMIQDARYKILVAHCPPYQTAIDRIHTGQHVGSLRVRRFIETYQPDVCISGHVHEAFGEDHIGKTRLLNPGMVVQGGYVSVSYHAGLLTARRIPGNDPRHYSTSPFLPPSL